MATIDLEKSISSQGQYKIGFWAAIELTSFSQSASGKNCNGRTIVFLIYFSSLPRKLNLVRK